MRSETNLLPVHSCASTAAKSTLATRSDCFRDPLVSVHRSLEPAECNLRNLLCIVVGHTERRATGRVYDLRNVTMVCEYIYFVILPSTRCTGRVQSTAGEMDVLLSSKATEKKAGNTHYTQHHIHVPFTEYRRERTLFNAATSLSISTNLHHRAIHTAVSRNHP